MDILTELKKIIEELLDLEDREITPAGGAGVSDRGDTAA